MASGPADRLSWGQLRVPGASPVNSWARWVTVNLPTSRARPSTRSSSGRPSQVANHDETAPLFAAPSDAGFRKVVSCKAVAEEGSSPALGIRCKQPVWFGNEELIAEGQIGQRGIIARRENGDILEGDPGMWRGFCRIVEAIAEFFDAIERVCLLAGTFLLAGLLCAVPWMISDTGEPWYVWAGYGILAMIAGVLLACVLFPIKRGRGGSEPAERASEEPLGDGPGDHLIH